jgi:hypothetical protein
MTNLKKGKIPSKSKLRKPDGPTDSEFRARYKIFELSDGTFFDSREIYWRNIPKWEEVVKITIYIRDKVHVFDKPGDGFLILTHQYMNPNYIEWCCGYIKGKTAHLTNIDFQSGEIAKEFKERVVDVKGHVHDNLKKKLKIK